MERSIEWVRKTINENISNIQINYNPTAAINGYGSSGNFSIVVSCFRERCNNCGYDSIYNPENWETACKYRHTYEARDYVDVYYSGNHMTIDRVIDAIYKEFNNDIPKVIKEFLQFIKGD